MKKTRSSFVNVLMITRNFYPMFGGAAVQAVHLANELKGVIQIGFFVDSGSKASCVEEKNGFKLHKVSTFRDTKDAFNNIIYVFRLIMFVAQHPEYKILHFHSISGYEACVFPLLKLMNRKILLKLTLVDYDDPIAFRKRKASVFISYGLKFVDAFVAISSALLEKCSMAGIAPNKVKYIPNGVDLQTYYPCDVTDKERLRRKYGVDAYKFIFLSVGAVEKRKGYDFMIDAWRHIVSQTPSALLMIVGPGNDPSNKFYKELQSRAQNLPNIIFAGQQEHIAEYMRLSDCFLFCSIKEGFGNVLIEAMASGIPVVSKRIPGVTDDIFDDNQGCASYSGESPEEFGQLAVKILARSKSINWESCHNDVAVRFDIKNIANQYIKLYEEIYG